MKDSTKKWLKYVKADMGAVDILFANGKKMGSAYFVSVFHCHQAVEKMIKTIMCEKGIVIIKIHNLVRLLGLAELDLPNDIKEKIADLNPHYSPPRYLDLEFKPSFTFTYNKNNTTKIINDVKNIMLCLKEELKKIKQ